MSSKPYVDGMVGTATAALFVALLSGCGHNTLTMPPGCPGSADHVTQWGITWKFDRPACIGHFANGDYWVVGPLTIKAITPNFDGSHAGWQVNPTYGDSQGFEAAAGNFDASLVPALPYHASPGDSIVKTVPTAAALSSSNCYPDCVQTAAVLTVVGAVPPGAGAGVFRPPYVGTTKPFIPISQLHTDVLPGLARVASAPAQSWVEDRFRRLQLNHFPSATGRVIRPADSYLTDDPYGATLGIDNAVGALWLMLDMPAAERQQALIYYVQMGIDWYYAMLGGQTWPAGGGYNPGMKLPIAFAAVLLDDNAMKTAIASAHFYSDTEMVQTGTKGTPLFGTTAYYGDPELKYWGFEANPPGYNLDYADPYGYIDASGEDGAPPDGYQVCCLAQPWKGEALVARIMPDVGALYGTLFLDYVDRWVTHGALTQPDPCAPADGQCSGGDNAGAECNTATAPTVCTGGGRCDLSVYFDPDGTLGRVNHYGVTYGPDGNGGCIRDTDASDGIGRFPWADGTHADDGYYGSAFVNDLWAADR